MDSILKLYTYVDGINDTPFPSEAEQVVIGTFTYKADRMGGAPILSATVKHRLCLDELWTAKVYAHFNGENYYVVNTPTSSKDNKDARYEHKVELLSERDVLNHVYFIDAVQGDSDIDTYKSNSTKVQFYGDVNEFVKRLNSCLSYRGLDYTAVVDAGATSDDKQVSFDDKYILEALQEEFNALEVPYYFVGKVIHFGHTDDAIPTVLKYGHTDALLSISKENANYQIINRITGTGSTNNIPFYYPNQSPKGDLGVTVLEQPISDYVESMYGLLTPENFIVINQELFSQRMSTVRFATFVYDYTIQGPFDETFFWVVAPIANRGQTEQEILAVGTRYKDLSEIGLKFQLREGQGPPSYPADMLRGIEIGQEVISYITPAQALMPSIYRETEGAERFYEAKNDTYPDGDGGYYEFENEFTPQAPREGITTFEDIMPTIKGVLNADGEEIDKVIEFAYDLGDNDEVDEEGNYLHPFFFVKLRKTDGNYGFNLFAHAIEDDTMQISFTSGACGACTFEIAVGEESQKNLVQVDEEGNLVRDEEGNVLCGRADLQQPQEWQERQNNTELYEVWIALRKDDSTYPQVMPNVNYNFKPSTDDTFVILNISLPKGYLLKAEDDLERALIKHMWENNVEKFTFSAKFSRIFFMENPSVLASLNENARVVIEYNGRQYTLYVNSYTYKMDGKSPLPEISVELVDTLSAGRNSLQNRLDSVKQDILSTIRGTDFLRQGLKYFLRKDVQDSARQLIKFMGGLNSDRVQSMEFATGGLGSGFTLKMDENGDSYLEVDRALFRKQAQFMELLIQKLSHVGGMVILSPASMLCSEVEEHDTFYRCFFETEDGDRRITQLFKVGDQARSQTFNLVESDNGVVNTYYWRLVVGIGDNYIDLDKADCDAGSTVPNAGDEIVQLGNRNEEDRQSAIILSSFGNDSPYFKMYKGIDSYSLEGKEFYSISRNEVDITVDSIRFSTGETIFEVIDGKVSSEVSEATAGLSQSVLQNTSDISQLIGEISLKVSSSETGFDSEWLAQTPAETVINVMLARKFVPDPDFETSYTDSVYEEIERVAADEAPDGCPTSFCGKSATRDAYAVSFFDVEGGERYFCQWYVNSAQANFDCNFGLHLRSDGALEDIWIVTATSEAGYSGWHKVGGHVEIPAGYTRGRMFIQILGPHGSDHGVCYFTNLVIGDAASAANLAYSSLSSSITLLNDEISLRVKQEDFDALGDRVTYAESEIKQNSDAISMKVWNEDIEEYMSQIPLMFRNRVKKGDYGIVGTLLYQVKVVELYEALVPGEKYTIVLSGAKKDGQNFGIWDGVGAAHQILLPTPSEGRIYRGTFTYIAMPNEADFGADYRKKLGIYNYPNPNFPDPLPEGYEMDLDWVCLYKGELASTPDYFVPALEETDIAGVLLPVGIDIDAKTVTVTAESFRVQDRTGNPITVFKTVGNNPVLQAQYIDVDNLSVRNIEGANGTFNVIRSMHGNLYLSGSVLSYNYEATGSLRENISVAFGSTATSQPLLGSCPMRVALDCTYTPDPESTQNIGSWFSVQGATASQLTNNHPDLISGNIALYIQHGSIWGFRPRIRRVTASQTLSELDTFIRCVNPQSTPITLTMPSSPEDGQIIWMYAERACGTVTLSGQLIGSGSLSTSFIMHSHGSINSAYMLVYDAFHWEGAGWVIISMPQ